MTGPNHPRGTGDRHDRPLRPDGGPVLRYGTPADAIGEPEQVFARFDGDFVLLDREVLGWTVVTDNEVEDGVVHLDGVSENSVGMVRSRADPVDIDALAARLADGAALDELGARVLLLFEGFELDPPEIAATLDTDEETVVERIEGVYDRYDEESVVERVREHHPDAPAETVRAFVLANGFRWDPAAIAEDLGTDEEAVARHLETAREEYPELAETLQQVI